MESAHQPIILTVTSECHSWRQRSLQTQSSPLLSTFLFNYYSSVPREQSGSVTAGARSFVNERIFTMQLAFYSGSNAIFQHTVIIFYTSSVYPNAPMLCMITISIDLPKSHWFCIPAEDEKTVSILFFFFVQIIQYKKENLLGKDKCSWLCLLTVLSTSWKHNAPLTRTVPSCANCVPTTYINWQRF